MLTRSTTKSKAGLGAMEKLAFPADRSHPPCALSRSSVKTINRYQHYTYINMILSKADTLTKEIQLFYESTRNLLTFSHSNPLAHSVTLKIYSRRVYFSRYLANTFS